MEKQELQQIYDLCIDELARYTLAGVQVNPKLLLIIARLEQEIKDKTILEKMELIRQKGPNIDLSSIFDKNYLNPVSNDYVNLEYNKNVYYYILSKNTPAADSIQPKAARPSFEASQYVDKMGSPKAAAMIQDVAAQPNYTGEGRTR